MAPPLRRSPPAFALVDVIVATILLAVGLGTVISLSGRAVRAAAQGEVLATAAALADEQLQLVLARGPDDYAQRFAIQGACDEPFAQYAYRLDFSGGRSAGETYTVAVTISWAGGAGGSGAAPATSALPDADAQSLTIETLMAPRTIGVEAETEPDYRPYQTIDRSVPRSELQAQEAEEDE